MDIENGIEETCTKHTNRLIGSHEYCTDWEYDGLPIELRIFQ